VKKYIDYKVKDRRPRGGTKKPDRGCGKRTLYISICCGS